MNAIAFLANRSKETLFIVVASFIVFIVVSSSDIKLSFAIDVHLYFFLFESLENSFFDERLVVNDISHFIVQYCHVRLVCET